MKRRKIDNVQAKNVEEAVWENLEIDRARQNLVDLSDEEGDSFERKGMDNFSDSDGDGDEYEEEEKVRYKENAKLLMRKAGKR